MTREIADAKISMTRSYRNTGNTQEGAIRSTYGRDTKN